MLPWALEVSRPEEGEGRGHLDTKGQPETGSCHVGFKDESRPFAQLLLCLVWKSGHTPATLALSLGHVVRIPNLTELG